MNAMIGVDAPKIEFAERLAELTTDIVVAYVSNNTVTATEIPELIKGVATSLAAVRDYAAGIQPQAPAPAVPISRSVRQDHITCLECGRSFRTLKRHLNSEHDTTPEDYKAKWGLPADYPIVAPDYAAERAAMARKLGLGKKRQR